MKKNSVNQETWVWIKWVSCLKHMSFFSYTTFVVEDITLYILCQWEDEKVHFQCVYMCVYACEEFQAAYYDTSWTLHTSCLAC